MSLLLLLLSFFAGAVLQAVLQQHHSSTDSRHDAGDIGCDRRVNPCNRRGWVLAHLTAAEAIVEACRQRAIVRCIQ